jgi:hypothetical protein
MKKRRKPINRIGRNEACPCGSQVKFKRCHGRNSSDARVPVRQEYIDSGESPIRWVIANETATAFFSDVKNRILVFADRQIAVDVIRLELFTGAGDNEINLAGVGPTKWQHLQDTLPFIEVSSLDMAQALLQERISGKTAELEKEDNTST